MNELEDSMKRRLEDYPAQEKTAYQNEQPKNRKLPKQKMAKYEKFMAYGAF